MLFVVTEMRMGGREQVVARISDGLLESGFSSDIFQSGKHLHFLKQNQRFIIQLPNITLWK